MVCACVLACYLRLTQRLIFKPTCRRSHVLRGKRMVQFAKKIEELSYVEWKGLVAASLVSFYLTCLPTLFPRLYFIFHLPRPHKHHRQYLDYKKLKKALKKLTPETISSDLYQRDFVSVLDAEVRCQAISLKLWQLTPLTQHFPLPTSS